MPETRQQTTPRQVPPRAAKRPRGEATDTPDVSASGSRKTTVSRHGPAAGAASSSGKKQKVQAEQAEQAEQAVEAPANANDKENTPSGSAPRRSTRTRTARLVEEVTPGPALIRQAKDHGGSTGRGAFSSTQKRRRQTSAGRQSSRAAQKQGEAANSESVSQSDKGTGPAAKSPQPMASALQPDGSPLQELPSEHVPTEAHVEACALHSVHSSSSQEQAPALQQLSVPFQSPEQPVSPPSPCTHPSQPGLTPNPRQQPQSPLKPSSPAATALAAASPAPGPSSAAAAPVLVTDPIGDYSSQEGSRHSSGHSNDHPAALVARKHLNWDSAGPSADPASGGTSGPTSGPTSRLTKPPLNKGAVTQPAQTGTCLPAADGDETWWDPTDIRKVLATSPARNSVPQLDGYHTNTSLYPLLLLLFISIFVTWLT